MDWGVSALVTVKMGRCATALTAHASALPDGWGNGAIFRVPKTHSASDVAGVSLAIVNAINLRVAVAPVAVDLVPRRCAEQTARDAMHTRCVCARPDGQARPALSRVPWGRMDRAACTSANARTARRVMLLSVASVWQGGLDGIVTCPAQR
eukprot:Opistho-2@61205